MATADTWHEKLKALYMPDLERARELMDARDGVGFVTHVAQWENSFKRKKSPHCIAGKSIYVFPEYSWNCLRCIQWVALPDIYQNQTLFDLYMEKLLSVNGLNRTMPGRWAAVRGRDEEFRALYKQVLATNDEEYINLCIKESSGRPHLEAVKPQIEEAMEFGRLDRAQLLYKRCWPTVMAMRDIYSKASFEVYSSIVEGANLWALARERGDKELALAAKNKFCEGEYSYCHGLPRQRLEISFRSHWPLAVDWEFQLTPGFDWDGWLANFQYNALLFEPWRNAIRDKKPTMPSLDVSWLPPRDEIDKISAKYAKK